MKEHRRVLGDFEPLESGPKSFVQAESSSAGTTGSPNPVVWMEIEAAWAQIVLGALRRKCIESILFGP